MKTETFAQTIKRFEYKVDLRTAFDDFLTMTICAFGQNVTTGKSYDEELYLETMTKYKNEDLRFEFPKLLACLTNEMTDRLGSDTGWDVLGDFYEQHIPRKGLSQFFTPWPICTFMAKSACEIAQENSDGFRPLRILDPTCGSGRMLMAASRVAGSYQEYYGIDVDHTCAKMTAVNLFLSGLFRTETMCADALAPDDFRVSYRSSFLPFGLFRIQNKEQSGLWHLMQNAITSKEQKDKPEPPELNSTKHPEGSQLTFF